MSKQKSEVLTLKTQLKVKFPQAVIINTRNLPLFSKMFWTAAWRKNRDGCFWHYVCKTIYLCNKNNSCSIYWNVLCVFLHGENAICSQRNSVGADRENIVPGNLCIIWKLNEAWPVKKHSVTFLRLLQLLMLKKNSITFLRLFKFLILKKGNITTLKVFNTKKGLRHFLITFKIVST